MGAIIKLSEDNIKNKIYTIRGIQVIADKDLAELYGVSVKALNQAVKRNKARFPQRFMFQLNEKELGILRSQFVTSNYEHGGRRYLPYVFTEQGVAMLSGVLRSDTAVKVSIHIMDAFVSMRKFISKNADIFVRLNNAEKKQLEYQIKTDDNFEKVFDAIESKNIKLEKGIFFDGEMFDAYKFISDLIRSAKKSIVLIDNYIDDSVLTFFSKRMKDVEVIMYTKNISDQLKLDLEKYNSQYQRIKIKEFKYSHDRFMIIDEKEIYHFGASLKDLGKKWFAFSMFEKGAVEMLGKLKDNVEERATFIQKKNEDSVAMPGKIVGRGM